MSISLWHHYQVFHWLICFFPFTAGKELNEETRQPKENWSIQVVCSITLRLHTDFKPEQKSQTRTDCCAMDQCPEWVYITVTEKWRLLFSQSRSAEVLGAIVTERFLLSRYQVSTNTHQVGHDPFSSRGQGQIAKHHCGQTITWRHIKGNICSLLVLIIITVRG